MIGKTLIYRYLLNGKFGYDTYLLFVDSLPTTNINDNALYYVSTGNDGEFDVYKYNSQKQEWYFLGQSDFDYNFFTKGLVTLDTAQTITGMKTFTADVKAYQQISPGVAKFSVLSYDAIGIVDETVNRAIYFHYGDIAYSTRNGQWFNLYFPEDGGGTFATREWSNNLINPLSARLTNVENNYATKAEVDEKLSSVYVYKGSVANYSDLPSSGNNCFLH